MLVNAIGDIQQYERRSPQIRDKGPYSARNSSKGALVEEAGRLFAAIASGMSVDEARGNILHGSILSQRSSLNRKRIWTLLQQRYLISDFPWTLNLLAEKSIEGTHSEEFVTLLYLLYSLRDRLSFDFVTNALWLKGCRNNPPIARNDVLDFLRSASSSEPQIDRWSESTRNKLAGSMLTALRDFGVLEGKQKKRLRQPPLPRSSALSLLRILVAEGNRGREIIQNPTWRLFLLTEPEVVRVLAKLAQDGDIRFERAGSTVVLETPVEWERES